MLLCRYHHRLVHEGGFGVERNEDGELVFTRPDGSVIDESPPMAEADPEEGFTDSIFTSGEERIDAADWIIPADALDLDLAVGGLMSIERMKTIKAVPI